MVREEGHVLVSQDIRQKIFDGLIPGSSFREKGEWVEKEDKETEEKYKVLKYWHKEDQALEGRIQTNSFEPVIENRGFWINSDVAQQIRTNQFNSIEEAIDTIPSNKKKSIDFRKEPELRIGETYFIPLREKHIPQPNEYIYADPKSSSGRTFADVKLHVDRCMNYDYIRSKEYDKELSMWLSVKPQKFNLVLPKGDHSFNQIEYFVGDDQRVSNTELLKKHFEDPILYNIQDNGKPTPLSEEEFRFSMYHLGLPCSASTRSVDGNKKYSHFDIKPDDYWLFFMYEYMHIPLDMCAHMMPTSKLLFYAKLHWAGFFDSNFTGQGVAEIRNDELNIATLHHRHPLTEFVLFHLNQTPDKHYGRASNSNYFGQMGVTLPKYFEKQKREVIAKSSVALRARDTVRAIDLGRKDQNPEDFYEIY